MRGWMVREGWGGEVGVWREMSTTIWGFLIFWTGGRGAVVGGASGSG